jgi:zinc protease
MKLRNLLAGALLLVCGFVQAQMPNMTIPVDTAVRIGHLPNGLTYYIRYNNWPENRANFYIAQKVGSIQEEESQRGLAHFLEHMAFNGSDHFKGNDLIEWCRSKGIEFGGDLNAYTSIDQTVYNIDNVPTQSQSTIDSCLLILRDWSTGLSLEQDEIDKERGVIHEEWRLRTSPSSRMLERDLPRLYPGSKYGVRYPIGLMSVVDNFKRKELVDYYHKWYHPSHQGIIVVGDVDVNKVEAEIKKLFSGIKNPDNEAPIVDEPVPDNAQPIVVVDSDKEFRQTVVEVMIKHDVFPDSLKQTLPYLIADYCKDAATQMLTQRLTEAAQKADCPFVQAGVSDGEYIFSKTKDALDLGIAPKDMSQTANALKAVFVELRRAAEFGFTPTEYKRFQDDYLSILDKNYSNKDKRYNTQFYNECKAHFLENEPMPSIDYQYQIMKQVVPNIPVEAINQILPELMSKGDSNLVIINFNNQKAGNVYPTEQQLLDAIAQARAEQITAYVDNVKNEPLITSLPKPGTIKSEKKSDKFDFQTLTLSNGVKVILKHTDYKKDQVIFSAFGPGGTSQYGQKDFANIKAFDDVIGASGLGDFSSTELTKALAGKVLSVNMGMTERHTLLSGNSTPKDLETMLQLVYLYFTNIKKDTESYQNLIQQYNVKLKNRELSPEVALSDSLSFALHQPSWRNNPMKIENVKDINYDRILEMAKENLASAKGWTFEIVGNFDNDSIRPLICRYLASLPTKGKVADGKRATFYRTTDLNNFFTRKMETPKANAYKIWINQKMPYTLANAIKADAAGQVLAMEYLKQIREDASAAYSCGAFASASIADDGYHNIMLLGYCPMKPEKEELAQQIMVKTVKDLTTTCDKEKLDKVKLLMLKQADDKAKTNSYWLNVIDNYITCNVDDHTDYKKIVESLTPADITSFAKEFLAGANNINVTMLPAE